MLLSLSGRESIVRLLLERAVAKPNSADTDGRTPLSFAAAREIPPCSDATSGTKPVSIAIPREPEV